jgi:magnesium transporter
MIVDCAHYRDGRRQDNAAMPLEQAAGRCSQGGFVWLGLFEPSPEELTQVQESFGLHALAVEDAQTFHLRPKVERYDSGIELAVLRTARYDDQREQIDTGEISIFLGENFVISVRKGVASELHGARIRLEKHPELLRTGSASVLWAILDQIVDCYAPVVAELDRDIEQIEGTVFSGAIAPTERIYFLRREVSDFYRAVHPLLSVLASQLQPAKWPAELQPYFRDVYDHLVLVSEEVAAQRDALGTILEANIAVISVEQNKITLRQSATIEQLTIFASVFGD